MVSLLHAAWDDLGGKGAVFSVTSIVIVIHILLAILFLGPVTVAVAAFPGQAARAAQGEDSARGAARLLHSLTNRYGVLSALVPLVGVAVMFTKPEVFWKMGQFHVAILLSVIAWGLLLFLILPRQKRVMGTLELLPEEDQEEFTAEQTVDVAAQKGKLAILSGLFSALWLVTALLMFV